MSKRYGRNQKRKATAKIKQLESELQLHNSSVALAKNIIKMVYNINPNSIVFKPSKINDNNYRVERYDLNVELFSIDKACDPCKTMNIRTIDLYDLEVELKNNSAFMDSVHFEATLQNANGGGYVSAYRISKEGFKYQSTDQIIKELVNHLKLNF